LHRNYSYVQLVLKIMTFSELLGNVAAFLTTISFLPQALQTIRTKDTKSLSLPMYLLFFIGVLLWVAHGVTINNTPLIVGNSITAGLAGIILFYKIRDTFQK
jgi:MtN3 and saliva related transmembrane protein